MKDTLALFDSMIPADVPEPERQIRLARMFRIWTRATRTMWQARPLFSLLPKTKPETD